MSDMPSDATWPDEIFAHLQRIDVRQVGYVPDAGHARLIQRCIDDPRMTDVVLTTEAEGVGLVVGAAFGGQRCVLLMQSSGVGNCVNMFSILRGFGVPCLLFVTMRGESGEFNPWQIPMGSITDEVLKHSGFLTFRIDRPDDVPDVVGSACDMVCNGSQSIAILLSQRLIGRKRWMEK